MSEIERLRTIRKLEKNFGTRPTLNETILLKELWINWREERFKNYSEKDAPNKEVIQDKINCYSYFIKEHLRRNGRKNY